MSLEFHPDSPPTPGEQLRKRKLDPGKQYDLVMLLAFSSGTGELMGMCVIVNCPEMGIVHIILCFNNPDAETEFSWDRRKDRYAGKTAHRRAENVYSD